MSDTVTLDTAMPPAHSLVDANFRPIKIIVYRNGEENDPGTVVMVTRREYKHWVVFLDGLTRKLKTVTAVHRVYDTNGIKIECFDDLHHGGEYVAVEKMPFIPCAYGSRRVQPVSARVFHVPWACDESKLSFLEGAESMDIYMKKQGYGSFTGLPYPLDGIVLKSPRHLPSCPYNQDSSGIDDERLNNEPTYMAKQIVDEVVKKVEKNMNGDEAVVEDNKENRKGKDTRDRERERSLENMKIEKKTTITEHTIISRVDGGPAQKQTTSERIERTTEPKMMSSEEMDFDEPREITIEVPKVDAAPTKKESDMQLALIEPPPKPDAAIIPDAEENKDQELKDQKIRDQELKDQKIRDQEFKDQEEESGKESKRSKWSDSEEIEVMMEQRGPEIKDQKMKLQQMKNQEVQVSIDKTSKEEDEQNKEKAQAKSDASAKNIPIKKSTSPAKKSTIPRAVKPATSRIETKKTKLPTIAAPNTTRVEKSTMSKKRVTVEPLSLPPIERSTVITEKRVTITTPKESARSYREAEDVDIPRQNARRMKDITGGWGGSERHLDLYDDDDIPVRFALPRTLTLPQRLNDRQSYFASRFERIHSYQRYPRGLYYYNDSDLDFDPDFIDV